MEILTSHIKRGCHINKGQEQAERETFGQRDPHTREFFRENTGIDYFEGTKRGLKGRRRQPPRILH